VILLDEPSTGMDPGARRKLWDAIQDVRKSGRSIIITSHSMEECEALCTRLAIMVNGRLQCLGNPQHLKTRFGEGYNLEVSVDSDEKIPEVIAEVAERFKGSNFKEKMHQTLMFDIPRHKSTGEEYRLAEAFKKMEDLKSDLQLGDYTLTQTSLEQVFLRLVKHQRVEESEKHSTNISN